MVTRLWDFFEEQAGGLFLLLAVLLVFAQIVGRSVGFGLSGLYEIATYFAVCSVFLTSSLAIKNNVHIRIDILANMVSPRSAFWLEMVVLLVIAVVSGALTWSGVLLVQESLMLGERTIGTVSLPVWAMQLILPLAGGLMLLRTLQRFWALVREGPEGFRLTSSELDVI
ncbi:MAG: TRAP transporter small permease [Comamonadaceae bacterium]|nr:MAG: TRAP transporter small permease [Comamonadaceae bacterium]